jgi:hypothetical protein
MPVQRMVSWVNNKIGKVHVKKEFLKVKNEHYCVEPGTYHYFVDLGGGFQESTVTLRSTNGAIKYVVDEHSFRFGRSRGWIKDAHNPQSQP